MAERGADRKIDYVEFNVTDIGRAKAFYGDAFGWTFTDYGEAYCEFQDGRLTAASRHWRRSRPRAARSSSSLPTISRMR